MKKDIQFPKVEHVCLAVIPKEEASHWEVHLINRDEHVLEMVMVTSKGYGNAKKTSILRHAFPRIEPGATALVEPIDPSVFHLTNEYWISFYIGDQIYDRKFIFVPDTIKECNFTFIKELDRSGILHK